MRLMPLISSALVLVMSGTSFAQEWTEFISEDDRFTITFPGQPRVAEIDLDVAVQRHPPGACLYRHARFRPLLGDRGRLQPD